MSFRKYAMTCLGAAIMAVSLDVFLVPFQIAPGGVSGLATVLGYFTALPVGLMILLINIPILLWGLFEFDAEFLVVSIFGTFALSGFTELFSHMLSPITDNEILVSVLGGAMLGLGMGVVLLANATTGGTDIVAKILKQKFPRFSIGVFILIIDAFVVAFAFFVTGKWETMLYSGIALYFCTKVVDAMVDGVNYAKMALIISDYPNEINAAISKEMQRGATNLFGYSSYSGQNKNVVMCVVRRNEIVRLKEIVKKTDTNSFVIVADVKEVQGRGFAHS